MKCLSDVFTDGLRGGGVHGALTSLLYLHAWLLERIQVQVASLVKLALNALYRVVFISFSFLKKREGGESHFCRAHALFFGNL